MSMKKLFPVAVTLVIGAAAGVVLSASDRGSAVFSEAVWTPFQDLPGVPRPGTSAVADFNQDGFDDFAFIPNNEEPDAIRVFVFWGNESGAFESYTTEIHQVKTGDPKAHDIYHYDLNAGDINGDGSADIIIPTYGTQKYSGDYGVIVLLGNGAGGFSCAGDVTGDGETGVKDILTVIDDWGCNEGEPLD
jgi:hypothetical protein